MWFFKRLHKYGMREETILHLFERIEYAKAIN